MANDKMYSYTVQSTEYEIIRLRGDFIVSQGKHKFFAKIKIYMKKMILTTCFLIYLNHQLLDQNKIINTF